MSRVSVKNVKDRVASLLEEHPSLRDDDNRLIANIWFNDALTANPDLSISVVKDFLQLVADGNLTNPESIRRSRQLVQEKNPHLRGNTYNMRQSNKRNIQKEIIEVKQTPNNQKQLWQ